jgi:hypothetical protein
LRALTLTLAICAAAACGPANAAVYHFATSLSGLNEAPPNASPATGFADVIFDDVLNTMQVNVTYAGLLGPNIAAHIHAATATPGVGTAPVATVTPTFTGFPSGTTAGNYSHVFDMTLASSYRAGFVTDHGGVAGAEAFLLDSLLGGTSYLNIHTTVFTGGEVRGFLAQVPEPATWALMIAGFGLAGTALRRRRAGGAAAG